MRRKTKVFIVGLLLCLVLLPNSVNAAEQPQVKYNARTHRFQLEHVNGSDLFVDFKGVMPGDHLTTVIDVATVNIKNPVRIYLDSEEEVIPIALESVRIRVESDGEVLSEDTLGQALNKGNRIFIHEFKQSGLKEVSVTLSVPETVGNEAADLEQPIRWEWIAQEAEGEYSSVQTGDNQSIYLWVVVCLCCVGIISVLLKKRSKN